MVAEGFFDVSHVLKAGVYLLLWKGEIVYVGQSVKPCARIATHVVQRGKSRKQSWGSKALPAMKFDSVQIRPCMLGELDALEKELIERFQPKYNIKQKPIPTMSLDMLIDLMPAPAAIAAPMVRPNASWRRL